MRAGERESQPGQQTPAQSVCRYFRRVLSPRPRSELAQADLMRQEFFECQATLGGVTRFGHRQQISVRGGTMDEVQRVSQRRQVQRFQQRAGQDLQAVSLLVCEEDKRDVNQSPQAILLKFVRRRVDRRQGGAHGGGDGAVYQLGLRVHHLEVVWSPARLPEHTQSAAFSEALLLRAVEMKETQVKRAATVGQPADQRPSTAEGHLGGFNLPLYEGFLVLAQGAYGRESGAVLVAQGQVKQQVPDAADLHFFEGFREFRPNAAQSGDGVVQ